MSDVLILIPAAGASSRMRGRDKLLEDVDGTPLLTRQVQRALATGEQVFVTVSKERPQRLTALSLAAHPNLVVTAPPIDASEGLAVSIRKGAETARALDAGGLMILLPDLPELESSDLMEMIAAFRAAPDRVHRATAEDGTPGHPVIFPRRLFGDLAKVTGDSGAKTVIGSEEPVFTPLPGRRAVLDLDTPEDWNAWRAERTD